MAKKGKSLAPKKAPGRDRKLGERGMKLLEEDLYTRPTLTYERRAQFLKGLLGVRLSKATICRAIRRLGYIMRKGHGMQVREISG
jgi:transposase